MTKAANTEQSTPTDTSPSVHKRAYSNITFPSYVLAYPERLSKLRDNRHWMQVHMNSVPVDYIDQSRYSALEHGKAFPSISEAIRLIHIYHTSLDYLFGLSKDKKPYPPRNPGAAPISDDERKMGITGYRLRCLRTQNHLTLKELGKLTSIDPSNLSKIELGKRGIPDAKYPLFAIELHASLDYILGLADHV